MISLLHPPPGPFLSKCHIIFEQPLSVYLTITGDQKMAFMFVPIDSLMDGQGGLFLLVIKTEILFLFSALRRNSGSGSADSGQ